MDKFAGTFRELRIKYLPPTIRTWALLLLMMTSCGGLFAYSVLTHEEIVDLAWTDKIQPLLLMRFPGLTEDQIREAHSYAYGGAVIQDLGYYPFGSVEFSDLVHYVRTGDFVTELLLESQDANEYAFALGALSHYASDIIGHPAVNQAVAISYPKLGAKYGKSVRSAQDKTAHLKTEFGFDMAQVAKQRYASQQYHDFIGFQVSKPLLERVFPVVYGLKLQDVLAHEDLAIGSFRYSVGNLIPHMTQVALRTHKKEIMRETPNLARRTFLYRLSRSDYERVWGKDYNKPGVGTRILSTLLHYIPKIGPLKGMDFRNPTPQTESMYFTSINLTVDRYKSFLDGVKTSSLKLADEDLDSGVVTSPGEYSVADESYAKLLERLAAKNFDLTSVELREDILRFYSIPSAPIETKKDPANWQNVLKDLSQLQAFTPALALTIGSEHSAQNASSATAEISSPLIITGFVGGFVSHDNIVRSEVQLAGRLRKEFPAAVVETFESYHGDMAHKRIMDLIDTNHDKQLSPDERRNARIIIYGHSWGGSEAITLARHLGNDRIPVLLTIQVDSIEKRRQEDALIPANVVRAVNFYQPNGLLHGQPDIRAIDATRTNIIGNFRFVYDENSYTCTGYPWWDRMITRSHTQIECDPAVWKAVETLIRSELITSAEGTTGSN
jgi:hypothetical protein